MNTATRIPLTKEFILNNIGIEIEWFCYGYSGNMPYYGTAKVAGIETDGRGRQVPIMECTKGDDLNFGFFVQDVVNYSDTDRPVFVGKEFDILTVLVENGNNTISNGNVYESNIIVMTGQTVVEKLNIKYNVGKVVIKETGDVYIRNSDGYCKSQNKL